MISLWSNINNCTPSVLPSLCHLATQKAVPSGSHFLSTGCQARLLQAGGSRLEPPAAAGSNSLTVTHRDPLDLGSISSQLQPTHLKRTPDWLGTDVGNSELFQSKMLL